jgi:hypothetical protein
MGTKRTLQSINKIVLSKCKQDLQSLNQINQKKEKVFVLVKL